LYQTKTFLDFLNEESIISLLIIENKENKKKISNLENYIKELEIKLKKKEKENNSLNDRILKLENELNKFKSYCLFPGEKLIAVKFISTDQIINNFTAIVKNTDRFSKLEELLYEKYQNYRESNNYFIINGSKVKKNMTLEENNIKNNDLLTLTESINDFD